MSLRLPSRGESTKPSAWEMARSWDPALAMVGLTAVAPIFAASLYLSEKKPK